MTLEPPKSTMAAPDEVREASLIDIDKLHLELESRTGCCHRLVPAGCSGNELPKESPLRIAVPGQLLTSAVCGHGRRQARHEAQEEWETLDLRAT